MSDNSEDISVNNNQFVGYSHSEAYSTYYTWKINDITKLLEFVYSQREAYTIISPEFNTGAKNADPWYLQLRISPGKTYYNPSNENEKKFEEMIKYKGRRYGDYVSIILTQKNFNLVRIKYKLFFINNNNEKIESISGFGTRFVSDWRKKILIKSECDNNISIASGLLLNNDQVLLKNDTLTAGVELIVYDYVTVNYSTTAKSSKLKSITDDFKDLFLDKKNLEKDIVIKVGDKKFKAHKFVLIMRSSFFEAMFTHNLEEKKNNEINLPDVDPDIFEKVLEFIYTDKVCDFENFAAELLKESDKYDLQELKRMCQEFLYKNISIENALEVMVTNYLQDNKELKEVAIEFIVNNYLEFKNTQQFKDLKKSYPSLYYEVLEKILGIENEGSETK